MARIDVRLQVRLHWSAKLIGAAVVFGLALNIFASFFEAGGIEMQEIVIDRPAANGPLLVATEDPHRQTGVYGDFSLSAGSIVRWSSAKVLRSLRVG